MHGVPPDDPGLLQAVQARNQQAAEALYYKYSGMLFGFLLTAVNDPSVAEQILVEVFSELPDTLHQYQPEYLRLYSFLLQQAREKIRGWYLNNQVEEQAFPVLPMLPEKFTYNTSFSPAEAELFHLCYYNGLTAEDIAASKGWSFEETRLQCRQVLAKFHASFPGNTNNDN